MGIASMADMIHVIGGVGPAHMTSTPLEFIPSTNTWQVFGSPLEKFWSQLGLELLGSKLNVVGGELGGKPTDQNLAYEAIYIIEIPVLRLQLPKRVIDLML